MGKLRRVGMPGGLFAVATSLCCTTFVAGGEGKSSAEGIVLHAGAMPQIVTPDKADRVETFAAKELSSGLSALFGSAAEVVSEVRCDDSRPRIYVGRTVGSAKIAPDAAKLPEDGFVLRGEGDCFCVAGSNPRGTLYGVYALLEDHLGARWAEPGDDGQVLPKLAKFDLSGVNETQVPSLPHRCLRIRGGQRTISKFIRDYIQWQARQRMNYLYWLDGFPNNAPDLLEAIKDRGFIIDNSGHSFERFSPEGRVRPASREDEERVADHIIDYLRTRPDISLLGLWMGDGWDGYTDASEEWCPLDYPDPRMITKEVDFRADEPKTCITNSYVDFVNRVQARVRARCPNVHLTLLAYNRSLLAPNKVSCAEGQQVHIAFRRSNTYGFGDPRSAWNSRQVPELKGWLKACPQVMLYEYYQVGNLGSVGRPYPRCIAQDLKYLKEIGAGGTASQSMPELFRSLGPNYYVYAKLSWNVDASVEKVLAEYYQAAYGPAAPAVGRLFDLWEETYNRGGDFFRYDWKVIVPLFTPEVLRRLKDHAAEASRLAAAGTAAQTRRAGELVRVIEGLDTFMCYASTGDKAALQRLGELKRVYPFLQFDTKNLAQAAAAHAKGL